MRIFVAGATGVVGRRVVPLLVAADHRVTAIARTPDKAAMVLAAGAEPVAVGLFDAPLLIEAAADHDAVINLATHIPDLSKAARSSAWAENDRIRTEGSRNLVDAAIAGGAMRYVQESVSFFYADGGTGWIDEDAPIDAPEFAAAFLAAEAQAARFADSVGTAVVLRFGMFYGTGSAQTEFQLGLARRGLSPFPGPRDGYQSFIHLDDAATAVLAALGVPGGTYNVTEDEPGTGRERATAISAALGKRVAVAVPGAAALGGKKTAYLRRSARVSNRRLRQASGWSPAYPTPAAGWRQVVAELAGSQSA